jgi:hypothetical protein
LQVTDISQSSHSPRVYLRYIGVLVYLTILLVHAVVAVLAYLVYHTSTYIMCFLSIILFIFLLVQDLDQTYSSIPVYLRLVSEQELIKALKGVFIALVVILCLIFLITLCMWQRIAIAIGTFHYAFFLNFFFFFFFLFLFFAFGFVFLLKIGVIKEASKAMVHIPTILLVPVGVGACIIPLAVYWFYIGA